MEQNVALLIFILHMRLFVTKFIAIIILLIVSLSFSGCHNTSPSTVSNAITASPTVMEKYCSGIRQLTIPLTDSCFNSLPVQKIMLPDSLSSFKEFGKLAGKIAETRNYIALLYVISSDVELPVLRTFTHNGEKISSLKLFIGNCCGENEDCSGASTFIITKNLNIIMKDSMLTFERNKKKFDKKKNIQLYKKSVEYIIDTTGKIIPFEYKA
jgi:hypothetical protein